MMVKVTGTNFPSQAAILWNGARLTTTVVSANTLTSTIGSSSLASPGTAQLQVQNTQTMQESQAVQVTIVSNASPLTVNISSLPQGAVSVPYNGAFSVTGGVSPYTWSVASGQLPPGLSLAAGTGIVSGTPTASGNYSFAIKVIDSGTSVQSETTTVSVPIAAAPTTPTPLTINSSTIPSGMIGSAYSNLLQASGGVAPYTWSTAVGSALPAGLTLSPTTGLISGTPTVSGTFPLIVTVADAENPLQTKSASLSIVIAPTPLTISTTTLASGTQSSNYSTQLQAAGGTGPYTWSIAPGSSLPAGLALSPAGVISGSATGSGNFSFGVAVKDAGSPAQTASESLTLNVVASGTPLAISTTSLSAGVINETYSSALNATGGKGPYTWSLVSGTLPTGLGLTAATGVISGTPTAISAASLVFKVTDSSTPVQSQSAKISLAVTVAPLIITNSSLAGGSVGAVYSSSMVVSGGTPAYTWSITNGSLPAGLTLAATTGVISGTPTTAGTSNFTLSASDNSSPVQTQSSSTSITVGTAATGTGTTWFVRPDGGTRYSSNVTSGQCNGLADAAYPGSGTNQNCAFNDVRYLWADNSGVPNAWVISGGDTVIVRGCNALPSQQNADNPHCRLGWDISSNGNPPNSWCGYGNPSYTCYNPPIPAGSASQHTRILGQNYAACNTGGATNPKTYANNLTQLFSGFSLGYALNLTNTSYVDIQCLEITTHNGACVTLGTPFYPRGCSTSGTVDDYGNSGILTNNATSNVTFQDVYIHGFTSSGMFGPIGGPIIMTRMFVGFNAFAGWNFDDGSSTPDAPGSSITANYILMEGNGCQEQYPITNDFPALVCYDTQSEGFGDSWSGQNTTLDTMYCNHCDNLYNTKDGFIGPHTWVTNLTITNSTSIGNMGQDWKWGGNTVPTTVNFTNNRTIGNCNRMSQPLPGAPSNYNQYLSGFCRAAGNLFGVVVPSGSTWTIGNNTTITYQPTTFDLSCPAGLSPCPSTIKITDNIFLGYDNPSNPYGPLTPAMYYIEDPSINVVSSYNVEFGMRNGDCSPPQGTGNICSDPLLIGEPAQGTIPPESTLDNFNFSPASGSPTIGAGTTYSGMPALDFNGVSRSASPTLGAIQP